MLERRIVLVLTAFLLAPGVAWPQEPGTPSDGTRRMVERLRRIAQDADSDSPYFNGARVRRMRTRQPPADPRERAHFHLMLGFEMLLAGESAEAVRFLERMKDTGESALVGGTYLSTLALAYLRLGEQENCLEHHTTDSCLVPIRDAGVHTVQRGSRQAIALYREIMTAYPRDLTSRWLLNLAYMTVGEHPQGVPEAWLIAPEVFESEAPLPRFQDVAPGLGLDVTGLSGGTVTEDFDGDGYLDVVASSWGRGDPLRYFHNDAGTFEERTAEALLDGVTGGLNLVHADYDNDGRPDVLVLRGAWLGPQGNHPNSLLRNRGGSVTFDDVTEEAGLLSFHPTQTASWGDYDNDGWVDLLIGNESTPRGQNPCELYRNRGPGPDGRVTFEEVGADVGLDVVGFVKAVVWGDYDNDGRLDVFMSRLGEPNLLLHNEGPDSEGRWRFRDVTLEAGVVEPFNSFPAWFWDYDNDGWLDLFVSGYGPRVRELFEYSIEKYKNIMSHVAADYLLLPTLGETPRLYRNRGRGAHGRVTFADVTEKSGLDRVLYTMGSNFGDLDNDGWLDFYAGTGDPNFESLMPNRMFRNDAGRRFQDVTSAGGFGHVQKGHGVAFADLDNDGDQDVYAVMGGAFEGDVYQNVLFENPGTPHRWVTLRLVGVESSRDALGARLRVRVETAAGDRDIYAVVSSGGSFGASSLRQEIGLGAATALRAVEITWPGTGETQVIRGLAMDRIYEIREGDPVARPVELSGHEVSREPRHADR